MVAGGVVSLPQIPPLSIFVLHRYANRLKEQGKLIELKEYDVFHAGALPSIAKGGSAAGAYDYAVTILKEYL